MGKSKASPKKDQTAAAKKLLAKAPGILKDVDDAVIFRNFPQRQMPCFSESGVSCCPLRPLLFISLFSLFICLFVIS
jgi:hypothetical protein